MRYTRQLALPEIFPQHQARLQKTSILMVGAGGLGAAALPYLAGAGIGHITIVDHDMVNITNLHRQTIFTEAQAGQNKAACAAAYLRNLNSAIEILAVPEKITVANAARLIAGHDLVLDGSDNFETKILLNDAAMQAGVPLIGAAVESFSGMAAVFAGHDGASPCYRCLYPVIPEDCLSCNDAGILGTTAGLAGICQAHLALCLLLEIGEVKPGTVLAFDARSLRLQRLDLPRREGCESCRAGGNIAPQPKDTLMTQTQIALVKPADIGDSLIVDVRNDDEVATDPIPGALHMRLDTVPARLAELPHDKTLAFACVSNRRSRQAAEYVLARGYENVCIMDRTG